MYRCPVRRAHVAYITRGKPSLGPVHPPPSSLAQDQIRWARPMGSVVTQVAALSSHGHTETWRLNARAGRRPVLAVRPGGPRRVPGYVSRSSAVRSLFFVPSLVVLTISGTVLYSYTAYDRRTANFHCGGSDFVEQYPCRSATHSCRYARRSLAVVHATKKLSSKSVY